MLLLRKWEGMTCRGQREEEEAVYDTFPAQQVLTRESQFPKEVAWGGESILVQAGG